MSRATIAEYKARFGISPAEAAGLVSCRHNRETGTMVSVYNAVEAGLDTWGWATVCEPHGSIMLHESRALAAEHAAGPTLWCEPCRVARDATVES